LQTQPLEITVDGIGVREVMATVTFTEDGVPQTYYLRSLAPVPVPEPVALAALGLVGGTAVLVRRRGTGAVGRVIGTPRRPGI
jgi:hypothetical protein